MKTYFLSKWTANLGVVPLLRFWALRFCPRLTSLRARRFSVTLVRETMVQLLKLTQLKSVDTFKWQTLTSPLAIVKGFLLITLTLKTQSVMAILPQVAPLSVMISVGELKEIDLGSDVNNFSLGNPDIISYKPLAGGHKLLIKGKKIGFSDLMIWPKKGTKRSMAIYVISKQKYLGLLQMAEQIKSPDLDVRLTGNNVLVTGLIGHKDLWQKISRLKKQHPDLMSVEAKVSEELKNDILGEAIKALLDHYIDSASCRWVDQRPHCHYSQSQTLTPTLKDYLEGQLGVILFARPMLASFKNYKLKIKIIQIEAPSALLVNTGLDRIQGNLGELFSDGLLSVLEKNTFQFQKDKIDLSLLASPEFVTQIDQKAQMEIGAEIPFNSYTQNSGSTTNWKFAGLRTDFTLKEQAGLIQVEYKTQLTRPDENGPISGTKEKSALVITPNKPIELYQIELKTIANSETALPLLSKIPLLGQIFKSKNNQENYKKIMAIALLEEMP